MRSILIEKYIEPSERKILYSSEIYERWFDRNYDLHSFMGHPVCIEYRDGKIINKVWFKKGVVHREGKVHVYVWYEKGQIIYQRW